jgi:oligoendopeptidase F
LAWSYKKYTSMTKNVLVMEKFHFYDQNDQLVMVDQMSRSSCDQFNLVISWS